MLNNLLRIEYKLNIGKLYFNVKPVIAFLVPVSCSFVLFIANS